MKNNSSLFTKGVEVASSVIIANEEGKILLTKSPKWNNKWAIPGGHIEPGENMKEAARREGEEETGLELDIGELVSFGELINPKGFHRPAHFIYFDFACIARGDQKVILEKRELSEYVWILPEEALEMDLAESYDKTIKDYMEYLKQVDNK